MNSFNLENKSPYAIRNIFWYKWSISNSNPHYFSPHLSLFPLMKQNNGLLKSISESAVEEEKQKCNIIYGRMGIREA